MPAQYVIIVAAGSGSRFGSELPKQFCPAAGRPVLMHTIERWRRAAPAADIRLVLSADMAGYWHQLCRDHGFESPAVVAGGATRYHSVKAALDSLGPDTPADAIVYVHDGARPLVVPAVVDRLSACLEAGAEAAVPVVPVSDSLRRLDPDGANTAVDRSQYVAVQTPQVFRYGLLRRAYDAGYRPTFTDDASVVEAVCGATVSLVEGSPMTVKITNRPDLAAVVSMLGK